MTDITAQPWTDADVDRYALVIAAAGGDDQWINGTKTAPDMPNIDKILMDDYRGDARAVLTALHEDGRLCPPGRADDALPAILAAIDNALRNGSHMTGGNLALDLLCDRLNVDRDRLVFRPDWAATVRDVERG
ncbi:hypothetical protein [Micromonospora sp. NBC_00421]|uniref:hypothetical protein n=1 Tax=Micromonospora sp. NBC_00421 TaxID=2975976 RepID=UPI002E22EADC